MITSSGSGLSGLLGRLASLEREAEAALGTAGRAERLAESVVAGGVPGAIVSVQGEVVVVDFTNRGSDWQELEGLLDAALDAFGPDAPTVVYARPNPSC